MTLKFNGAWRFNPPPDAEYITKEIPESALVEFIQMINTVSTQGDRQDILEHFKSYFCDASGSSYFPSSTASWTETDLYSHARAAARNAPRFIEGLFDACRSYRERDAENYAPDEVMINQILEKHRVGYQIRAGHLILRGRVAALIEVTEPPPTLTERAAEVFQTSLNRSEELLNQRQWREAVQESLWLLETIATAFRGVNTNTGTIGGKYFNEITKELRKVNPGGTLGQVVEWATKVYGYLSSPTGGGVRHGLDLNAGIAIGENEARLFCNLIRSFLSFLLVEHEKLMNQQ